MPVPRRERVAAQSKCNLHVKTTGIVQNLSACRWQIRAVISCPILVRPVCVSWHMYGNYPRIDLLTAFVLKTLWSVLG